MGRSDHRCKCCNWCCPSYEHQRQPTIEQELEWEGYYPPSVYMAESGTGETSDPKTTHTANTVRNA